MCGEKWYNVCMESPLTQPNEQEKPVSFIPESTSVTTPKGVCKTNPYGVNQYTNPDPRWTLFLSRYLDPKSHTFSKAYKSAVEVGYSPAYAKNIRNKSRERLVTFGDKSPILSALEKSIDTILDIETKQPLLIRGKPIIDEKTGEIIIRHDSNLLGIVSELTMTVLERIAPEKWGKKTICGSCKRLSFNRK